MWQRWNQGTHIFEKSTDNGASWSPLGLSGSIITEGSVPRAAMPPNVAFADVNNYMVAQTFASGNWVTGANSPLMYYNDTSAIADQRIFRQLLSSGNLIFEFLNDAINVSQGSQAFHRDGAFSTTFYIRSGNVYYELGRGAFQGQRIAWGAVVQTAEGANCGGSITSFFSLVGYQICWTIYAVNVVVPASTAYLRIIVPAGYPSVSPYTDQAVIRGFIPAIGDEPCYTQIDAAAIQVYRMKAVAWPAGTGHVIGQGFYYIG